MRVELFKKYDRVLLKELVADGLIGSNILYKLDVYFVFLTYLNSMEKRSVSRAIQLTSDKFDKDEREIYKIKSYFEKLTEEFKK